MSLKIEAAPPTQVVGQNCRFLQSPPGKQRVPTAASSAIRRALDSGRANVSLLLGAAIPDADSNHTELWALFMSTSCKVGFRISLRRRHASTVFHPPPPPPPPEMQGVRLLNYCKDGTPIYNDLSICPLRNARGQITHHVGMQVGSCKPSTHIMLSAVALMTTASTCIALQQMRASQQNMQVLVWTCFYTLTLI